jgi:hypothetical protein
VLGVLIITTLPTVSERDEATATSIIDKAVKELVAVVALEVIVDIGTTKAETPFIIVVIVIAITQNKIAEEKRHMMVVIE